MRHPRDPRRSHCARETDWCPHLLEKTTGTPPLDCPKALKARHLPHSECPRCPETASSSPREGTKATANPNVATTTCIQVPEAPQISTNTPSLDHHADPGGPRETSSAAAALLGLNWEDFSAMIATETTKGLQAVQNCTPSPMVLLYFTKIKQNIRFRRLLSHRWKWILAGCGPFRFFALQGPPGA